MDNEKETNYVTKSEMLNHTHTIQKELSEKIYDLDEKHTEKHNELKILFAQMNETNKHIAENTRRTAENLERFGEEVKDSAKELSNKLQDTNSKVSNVTIRTEKLEEKRGGQLTIIVALISGFLTLLGVILKPIIESFFM